MNSRNNRGCDEQVLDLTTLIEACLQKKLKASICFIDLSASYDTVWKHGLLWKFSNIIKCRKLVMLLEEILANRCFQVYLGNKGSRRRIVNNERPQGSILALTLFNLYVYIVPKTKELKFQFEDDIAIAYQSKDLKNGNVILTEVLE